MSRETTVSLIMGACSPMKILTDIDITCSQKGKIPCERTVMPIRNSQLSYTFERGNRAILTAFNDFE